MGTLAKSEEPDKIVLIIANSVDPYEMQVHAAFHLGLQSLTKYLFGGFPVYKGLKFK